MWITNHGFLVKTYIHTLIHFLSLSLSFAYTYTDKHTLTKNGGEKIFVQQKFQLLAKEENKNENMLMVQRCSE